ncbi:cytochrome P450 [Actinomadura sp. NTSP31]|uniref:cytochrome P450 n=1 Tax=Actinomadura sp. NTSP31 TaxID=1735447 RepID=UPI0035C21AC9
MAGPSGAEAVRWWMRMMRDPMDAYGGLFRRYGDAVRLPRDRRRALYLLSRPEHAEHVLVAKQDNYVKAFTYRPLRVFLGDGLLTSEGETWRRHRRLVQPAFAQRHVTAFAPGVAGVAARGIGRWPDGVMLDAAAHMRRITLDVVGRVLFGSELAGESDATGRALANLQRSAVIGIGATSLGDAGMRRVFRLVPGAQRAGAQLDGMVRRVIDERREAGPGEEPDLLDLLMRDVEAPLSDAELRDEVLTLLLAGHETTAAALTWTLILLSRYPAARDRLEAEVDGVLGDGLPDAKELDRLPWTRAVLSESMRLYPPAWTIERDAVADDDVAGAEVSAGSTVAISPYLLHRNPDLWPDPEGFRPERFLGEQDRPRHAYLPFGGGRRICVGAGFAMMEAVLVLALIAREVRLDLAPGVAVPSRAEVTLRPARPVPMRVSRR